MRTRARGTTLYLTMMALAVIGVLSGVVASRFAEMGAARKRRDVRVQLQWAARTAAASGAQGRAVVDGRVVLVENAGSSVTARSGQSRVTLRKNGAGWTP